jgi:hypothetical protein
MKIGTLVLKLVAITGAAAMTVLTFLSCDLPMSI